MPDPIVDTTATTQPSLTSGTTPLVEEPPITGEETTASPHPLEPEGERFKQVWARAKKSEEREAATAAELAAEREKRIRYEERLAAQDAATASKAKEAVYSWQQLEDFISNGQLTRAQANEYREAVLKREFMNETARTLEQQVSKVDRERSVLHELERFKTTVPNIMTPGTPERVKIEEQYRYLTGTLGYPDNYATQLVASRLALGSIDTLEKARSTNEATREYRETTVETTTAGKPPQSSKPDLVAKLDERQRAHYANMIRKGRYKDWGAVRDELAWERGQGVKK